MDTPNEIRYNKWWEREGRYIEEAKSNHPCYSCEHFEQCIKDVGSLNFEVCEDYTEE